LRVFFWVTTYKFHEIPFFVDLSFYIRQSALFFAFTVSLHYSGLRITYFFSVGFPPCLAAFYTFIRRHTFRPRDVQVVSFINCKNFSLGPHISNLDTRLAFASALCLGVFSFRSLFGEVVPEKANVPRRFPVRCLSCEFTVFLFSFFSVYRARDLPSSNPDDWIIWRNETFSFL